MNTKEDVVKRVRQAWAAHKDQTGATQAKAAEALGMNQSAYSQYIRGEIPLNAQFLRKFSQMTGVPLADFGVEGDVPSQDLRTITLPVKMTLSGKELDNKIRVVRAIVPHDNCYLVEVDYVDHVFPRGSTLVVDPMATLHENDAVLFLRRNAPIVYGYLAQNDDGWEIIEPHWFGGRTYVVDVSDSIQRAISLLPPTSKGAKFR